MGQPPFYKGVEGGWSKWEDRKDYKSDKHSLSVIDSTALYETSEGDTSLGCRQVIINLTRLSIIHQLLLSVNTCHLATTITLPSDISNNAISGRSILVLSVRSISVCADWASKINLVEMISKVSCVLDKGGWLVGILCWGASFSTPSITLAVHVAGTSRVQMLQF